MPISLSQKEKIWESVLKLIQETLEDRHVYVSFFAPTKLYKIDGQVNQDEEPPNPSSALLWQDVLMGLYDAEVIGLPMETHYKLIAENFEK